MTRLWQLSGAAGVAIVLGCAVAFFCATPANDDFIKDGHVVVNGTDYGVPGEKAFQDVVQAEGLVGSDEIRAVGPSAYDEVRDVAQLYCALRARYVAISAEDMVGVATEAFSERYARAKSETESILREAAAAEASKYWCPDGYVDARLAAPTLKRSGRERSSG